MQAERIKRKCAICGREEYYIEIISNYINGAPDLDLRINGSMASHGSEVQECPHCHYCNYNVEKVIQDRFTRNNALELWNCYEEVQKIIKKEQNPVVRKYLVLAEQYKGNIENKKQYLCLINAAWASENEKQYYEIMNEALSVYVTKVLPDTTTQILQMADIARQVKEYKVSQAFVSAVASLNNDANDNWQTIEKIVKFQNELIGKKDNKPHNLMEIPK